MTVGEWSGNDCREVGRRGWAIAAAAHCPELAPPLFVGPAVILPQTILILLLYYSSSASTRKKRDIEQKLRRIENECPYQHLQSCTDIIPRPTPVAYPKPSMIDDSKSKVKNMHVLFIIRRLLRVRRRQCLNHTGTFTKPRLENAVGILEHAILERHNNELRSLESGLDQATDILRVRQVESGVDLVENVHWRWLELQKRHDQ